MTPILSVRGLSVAFPVRGGLPWRRQPPIEAVRRASFDVGRGEVGGLVGESGSGKTTVSRALLRLVPAASGSVTFDGLDVLQLDRAGLRRLRRRLQLIFQDPYTSLNPRLTAGANVAEGMHIQGTCVRRDIPDRVRALLRQVELPSDAARRYPHELCGGQRQRLVIARALAVEPEFLIADEPVSALDMSIQAQILNLLVEQQRRRGLTILFIGHDLSVIRQICDRVIVMYRGDIVEIAPAGALFDRPAHAYTRALLLAAPARHPSQRLRTPAIEPDPPWRRAANGRDVTLREVGEGHFVADAP